MLRRTMTADTDTPTHTDTVARLRRFATREAPSLSPLYAQLAACAADDPVALEILAGRQPGQPPANILLSAIHALLLDGTDHPLRRSFPDLSDGGRFGPETAGDFADFCRVHRAPLAELVARRRVSTNEARRSAVLYLAFQWLRAQGLLGGALGVAPIDVIEVGTSAGLNQLWDRFGYDFGHRGRMGDPASPVRISPRLRGSRAIPPDGPVPVGRRIGIDLAPLDVRDADDRRWLRALVWPEETSRRHTLHAALEIARRDPPEIMAADAMAALPALITPGRAPVCVMHTIVLYQFPKDRRRAFTRLLINLSRRRPVLRIAFEPFMGSYAALHVHAYDRGRAYPPVELARADAHIRRITWLGRS